MSTQTPAKQLYDLLVSRNFDPELLDSKGQTATDPSETEVFSFDYTTQNGNDYGTIVIMITSDNDLEVYFGDNIGRGMEADDKKEWFDFLYQLRMFAKRNLMTFGLKNLNRLRYSMQGQAAISEGLFESWRGTKTTSWDNAPTEARLMIKHKRPLGEHDARFRYVESLFVETAEGERYKLPFTKLSGGRAMVEHVRQGGRPYDAQGQHITQIVNELNVLSRFRRANHGKIFEGDTANLIAETNAYYETAKNTLKSLSTSRGYRAYFEAWNPKEVSEESMVIEGLKHLFVTQSLDSRIEEALPILARIQQQGNEMKEANIFESWVNNLVEGTWSVPETPEEQAQLADLLSKELIVGADATNATEQLYDLLGDDVLFDLLDDLAQRDANANAWDDPRVMARIQELGEHPSVAEVLAQVDMDVDVPAEPAEPEQDLNEGSMKEIMWKDAERMSREQFCSKWGDEHGEFWDNIMGDLDDHNDSDSELARIKQLAGNKEETDEGMMAPILGALGGMALGGSGGEAVGNAFGSDVGGAIGQAIGQEKAGTLGGMIGKASGSSSGASQGSSVGKAIGATAGGIAGLAGGAAIDSAMNKDKEETNETELGTAIGAGLGGAVGGIGGAALGGLAGKYISDKAAEKDNTAPKNKTNTPQQPISEEDADLALIQKEIEEGLLGTLAGGALGALLPIPGGAILGAGAGQAATQGGSSLIEKDEEMGEGLLGTLAGGALGSLLPIPGGAILGAGAGQAATQGGSSLIEKDEEMGEGWKGQLAGGTLGSIAGTLAGGALPIPGGALIGGALGGTGGSMLGDKLGGPEEPDTTEETDEGIRGALAGGALGAAATKSTKGAIAGAKLGSAIQDRFAKKKEATAEDLDSDGVMMTRPTNCSNESSNPGVTPEPNPLAGQYGHSGRLEKVADKAGDIVARLKELSGMMRT